MDDTIEFLGSHWAQIDGDVLTVGLTEECVSEISGIDSIDLPSENDSVESSEVIGSLESGDGSINLYSPVTGKIIEINEAIIDDPSIIESDPTGEGWLYKIEADDGEEVSRLLAGDHVNFDEDEDDDSDDDDDDEEENETEEN
ncbi:MAG: glycine cleavage system protein H [Bdellovibrionales bacterium]|nr:glycine cleavage system protein H [Bdellovibrionales bacterium]